MATELRPVWPGAPRHVPDLLFPPYRFVPGLHPHPVRDPGGHARERGPERLAPRVPATRWREDRAYLFGIDLYHAGYLWEAHEAWEGAWRASPDPVQREFLQGLIQVAAGLLQAHVGRTRGARKLARSAHERLARVAARHPRYMGLDVAALAQGLAQALAEGGLGWNAPPRLALETTG